MRFVRPFCDQIFNGSVEVGESSIVRVEVFGAPPFGKLGVPLMSGIGKRLTELLVSSRPTDVFRRAR